MIEAGEYSVTLEDGSEWITQGEHQWQDSGLPGMSRCACGVNRHYNRDTGNYWYSLGR